MTDTDLGNMAENESTGRRMNLVAITTLSNSPLPMCHVSCFICVELLELMRMLANYPAPLKFPWSQISDRDAKAHKEHSVGPVLGCFGHPYLDGH